MQITINLNPHNLSEIRELQKFCSSLLENHPKTPVPTDEVPWSDPNPFPVQTAANPANPEPQKEEPKPEPAKRDTKELKASIRSLGLEIVAKGQDAKVCFWNLLTGIGTPTISPATHPKIGDIPEEQLEAAEAAMKEMLVKLKEVNLNG